ncbi:type IV pilus twitching motility protein PilT [Heliorestis acidaminivorans]|uniref:Type IV pilus twitching motility protein PilT n=1 Tax=Heliorestis acidaminivorans TaxID=553427 RepID=A0A6I0EZJ3_9FIRM|nr:type IV pilus twitching motility protein PilT [Heliorestis acidaminivorans]KAB2951309.1 type IV pilus twitching motility protein PilT [Heliorestis acidaminivorans]
MSDLNFSVKDILTTMVKRNGSDLHLTVGKPPVIRVFGDLITLDEFPLLKPKIIDELIYSILTPEQKQKLNEDLELDFSHSVPGVSRFRGNIMWQRGTIAANFRSVAIDIPSIEKLGLPPVVRTLAELPRGLVLVTGPTGSGKSTTLASIIDLINTNSRQNIVTIENPIEFLHNHKQSIIKQREVETDTKSFANALRHVLRHDPDVILVGEMRDLESTQIGITAAETGHLVFSTLHTQTATLAVNRIIDIFPSHMRNQIAQQVAGSLQGVIAQQLVPRADGKGRVAALEILICTPAIRNLIREGKEHQLYSAIQTNRNLGMVTMDQSLAELFAKGIIDRDTALEFCVDKVELERALRKSSMF